MTTEELAKVPARLLRQRNTVRLRLWLAHRDLSMSLLELDAERRRRGINPADLTDPTKQHEPKEHNR